jgi:hypothetical protein
MFRLSTIIQKRFISSNLTNPTDTNIHSWITSFLNQGNKNESYKEVLFQEKVKLETEKQVNTLIHEVFPRFCCNSDVDSLDYQLLTSLRENKETYSKELQKFEENKKKVCDALAELEKKQKVLCEAKHKMVVSEKVLYSFRNLTHPWFHSSVSLINQKKL